MDMLLTLKNRLRERLIGNRFSLGIRDFRSTLSKLGNLDYLTHHPEIISPGYHPPLHAYEFSYFSQNGEDGLILYLLSRIGVNSHFIVEIGIEDGRQCNSANLILNFGWRGCVIEASSRWAEMAKDYFRQCGVDDRVHLLDAAAKPESINELLSLGGVPEQVDVLSIDIDSFDYWLWSSIDTISPGLVVIEYNASFGPDRSVTVPYTPEAKLPMLKFYHGASITALVGLADKKGYILVGCDSKGVNAFFVRKDLASAAGLQSITPGKAFRPHYRRTQKLSVEEQFGRISHLPLDQINGS